MHDPVLPQLNLQLMCVSHETFLREQPVQGGPTAGELSAVSESTNHLILPRQVTPRTIDQQMFAAFDISFEAALEQLGGLPGVFVEPDGFFMWHSRQGEDPEWQLSGMIYDRPLGNTPAVEDSRVCWCEFKGSCPLEAWVSVVRSLGTAEERIVAYLQAAKCFVVASDLQHFWETAC